MSASFVHRLALVETDSIGEGTRVWAFAHVMAGAKVGRDCNIGEHCFIETGASIGDRATVKNGVLVWDGVEIGDGAFIGPGVVFTNDLRPRSPRLPEAESRYASRESWLARTVVATGATIGAGAVILPALTIGAFSMIGAGAVVTASVPEHGLVVGNPGKAIGWVCRCGERLKVRAGKARCACRRAYKLSKGKLSASK